MKICVISTNVIPCPPSGYSGLEMLTYQQAVGLHNKGHKVAIICPKGSKIPAGIEHIETELGESEKSSYSRYWPRLPEFDCILDSSWQKWSVMLKLEGRLKAPSLLWLHCPANTMISAPPPLEKPCFVAISKDMSNHVKELFNLEAKVCYNGVDTTFYKNLNLPRKDKYLFLSRFSSIKGADIAISACKNTNVFCDFVGDDQITAEPEYAYNCLNECAKSPRLRFVGPQTRDECVLWFNQNKALLHPIQRYREPFGLTIVESQLCGMPILAWNNGSMKELVKHGETGYLYDSQEELEQLIKCDAVSSIKSEHCIENAMQFSYEAMINRCEELVKEAVETGGW